MASNKTLNPTGNHRWFNGFGNMFYEVNHKWWGTRFWLIQVFIWIAIIDGILAATILSQPKVDPSQPAPSEAEIAGQKAVLADLGLEMYLILSGMFAAVGVVVLAQDALIGEKRSGTAAWVLSKPVSRSAFLLAKLAADAIGILVTLVFVQGVIGYFIFKTATGISLPITNCLAAVGLVTLMLLFFLSLTYLLGAVSNARGLVIGLPLVLIFAYQFSYKVPALVKIMPWNLVMDMFGSPSLAGALFKGEHMATVSPIIGTAVLTALMIGATVWRFRREEF